MRTQITTIMILSLLATLVGCAGAPLAPGVREDIQAQIHGRQAAYANCYTSALKTAETLKGDASLTFMLMPTGALDQVAVTDAGVNNQAIRQCVADATSAVVVSTKPAAPVQVSCQLSFQPAAMTGKALGEAPPEGGEAPAGGAQPPAGDQPAPPAKP